MKKINFVVALFLSPLFVFAKGAPEKLIPVNLPYLKKLSSESFKIEVDKDHRVRLNGHWPKVCAKGAEVSSEQTDIGFGIRVKVPETCYRLLKLNAKQIAMQPQVPMLNLFETHLNNTKQAIYVKGVYQSLDIHLRYEDFEKLRAQQDSMFVNKPINEANKVANSNLNSDGSNGEDHVEGSIKYRKCKIDDYGSTDPRFCQDRFGFDLNADIPIRHGTKIVGTTRMDFVIPERIQDSFADNLGVNVQVIQEINDSLGGR